MKLLVMFCIGISVFSCAPSRQHNLGAPNNPQQTATSIDKNLFEQFDGCYELISPKNIPSGTTYTAEIKSLPDQCAGATVGHTDLIINYYSHGQVYASTGPSLNVLPSGQYVQGTNIVRYDYQGVSYNNCTREDKNIQVENFTIQLQADLSILVSASAIHCDKRMTFEQCKSLAPQPVPFQLKKTPNCLPK